jgi:tetratricopeptide (TPR) repeat protein
VALAHAREATALDPRGYLAAFNLTRLLVHLRKYEEARAAAERGLTVDPSNLTLLDYRALSWIGVGDLAAARASLRDVPPTLDRATLVAYERNWWLDSADRALLLTLPPAAFDNNRFRWATVRADFYWLAGDTVRARIYADSVLVATETQFRPGPDSLRVLTYRGAALAYLGRRADAERASERYLERALAGGDQYIDIPSARYYLAITYIIVGDRARAIDQLDTLLAKPYYVSPAWLRIDPWFTSLRGDPRFEQLLTRPWKSPVE